ncbi:Na(+)/H(+) antiporter subunit F1 [Sutcliffiella rhizosphaerae]|uniref:Na(+)/H(+) antiporter subunit F n=1 Tax=Sutcliffiella rhizosphaerae TaxID=2880967 RepID=A0ABM8YJG1_9BACI|nr:Na(+)/H(+) antiporter subunit F1 [Sutcliffiella rhizosphaerae]CAG9620070.1 Na(+)/H(+) antiporter subunit F [Sutcliffiella rhizosphaerae]
MFEKVLMIVLIALTISIIAAIYRVVKGPSMPDRVIALDMIGINLVAAVAVISVLLKTYAFLEVILLIGILSFVGTIAFARFIERGVVIERNRDN